MNCTFTVDQALTVCVAPWCSLISLMRATNIIVFSILHVGKLRLSKVFLLVPRPQLRISITNLYSQIFIECLLRARHIVVLSVLCHLALMTARDLLLQMRRLRPRRSHRLLREPMSSRDYSWVVPRSRPSEARAGVPTCSTQPATSLDSSSPRWHEGIGVIQHQLGHWISCGVPMTTAPCPVKIYLAYENSSEKGFVEQLSCLHTMPLKNII